MKTKLSGIFEYCYTKLQALRNLMCGVKRVLREIWEENSLHKNQKKYTNVLKISMDSAQCIALI